MEGAQMMERLRFDIKYLLWRAEVYQLQADEIEQRFQDLATQYRRLAVNGQAAKLERELREWHIVLRNVESRLA